MASIFGHIFDWILEHVIYPIMTLGKVDRDWDNNDSWNHQTGRKKFAVHSAANKNRKVQDSMKKEHWISNLG